MDKVLTFLKGIATMRGGLYLWLLVAAAGFVFSPWAALCGAVGGYFLGHLAAERAGGAE